MITRSFKGFGPIKTPIDLLQKIRYDFKRLHDAPDDVYAAYDFFVSAYHMLDWLHHKDNAGQILEERNSPLLQVCSHLANGIKHFEAEDTRHKSVYDVEVEKGLFQRGLFQPNVFQVGGLFIRLDGQAASMFGAKVKAVDFAQNVLVHWEADSRLIVPSSP